RASHGSPFHEMIPSTRAAIGGNLCRVGRVFEAHRHPLRSSPKLNPMITPESRASMRQTQKVFLANRPRTRRVKGQRRKTADDPGCQVTDEVRGVRKARTFR